MRCVLMSGTVISDTGPWLQRAKRAPVERSGSLAARPRLLRAGTPRKRGEMTAKAVWALEIIPVDQRVDPHTRALRSILRDLGAHPLGVTHGRLFLFNGDESVALRESARALCLDPIIATATPTEPSWSRNGWVIEILPHPGVTDAEGDSLADALARDGFAGVRARAGHRYWIEDALDPATIAAAARRLAHAVVESVAWRSASCPPDEAWWRGAFMPEAQPDPTVETVAIRELDADQLQALSARRLLSLPREDMAAISDHYEELGRDPTDVELETIAQTWSEHCAHRTFKATILHREPGAEEREIRGLLKTFIMAATESVNRPWVLSAFRDNAGRDRLRPRPRDFVQGRDAQPSQRAGAVRRREHRRRRRGARRAGRLRRADRQHRRALLRPARHPACVAAAGHTAARATSTTGWWPASPTTATRWASRRSTARRCSIRGTSPIRSSSAARSGWRRAIAGRRSRGIGDLDRRGRGARRARRDPRRDVLVRRAGGQPRRAGQRGADRRSDRREAAGRRSAEGARPGALHAPSPIAGRAGCRRPWARWRASWARRSSWRGCR